MAVIKENDRIAAGVYHMQLQDAPAGKPGQFVMLRLPHAFDPLLGRPISLFHADAATGTLELVYQVVGRGTALFSQLLPGQEIDVSPAYGNGFPLLPGDATLIGGGIGCAPLYYLLKALKAADASRRVTLYMGFREEAWLPERFAEFADEVQYSYGGFVTEDVDFSRPGTYYACGPTPMLQAAYHAAKPYGQPLYVSLEQRMACGAGACHGCTITTAQGNRRVCKDGPVFLAKEVFQ